MRIWKSYIFIWVLVFVLSSCERRIKRTENLIDYIPPQTERVLKISDLSATKGHVSANRLLSQLKETSFFNFLKSNENFLPNVNPTSESILCLEKVHDSLFHYTLITRKHDSILRTDSTATTTTSQYKKLDMAKTEFRGSAHFSATIDSIFVISTSEEIIHAIIDGKSPQNTTFYKALSVKKSPELAAVFPLKQVTLNDTTIINMASQASLELTILPEAISAHGVLLDRDSVPQLLSVFKGLVPQQNMMATMLPTTAKNVSAFTYNDVELLENNLQEYHQDSIALSPVFETVNEVIGLTLKNGYVVGLKSIDPEITLEELQPFMSEKSSFREVTLFDFKRETPMFSSFSPLIESLNANYIFQLGDFFLFTEKETAAQEMITAFKNNATLQNAPYYENVSAQLSKSSSFLHFNLNGDLDEWIAPFLLSTPSTTSNYPFLALQLSYDRDFAHLNFIGKEATSTQQGNGVIAQNFTKKIDAALLSPPIFFSNHRTKKKDVVVQDIQNKLHLLSANGRILWSKQLDGAILGSIQEVDILKNGKKQLAFVTPKTFYVLDRNGKQVTPFPKKFKDEITQPLAIFDYDNKRNYRFVIVQNKEVMMYDNKGNTVTGFTFKKTESPVVLPPQHIRMRTKDYILIAEKNGKLNILSRTGKERVSVNKTFQFADLPIAKEGSNFVVITKNNTKESISQRGKVTTTSLGVSENYHFTVRGATKVTLDDNLLRINGKLIELPFGLYSSPNIYISNKNTYITVTDLQEKKVYLYTKDGKLFPGFPIYGSSAATLANIKNKTLLTVSVGNEEVALYSFE